jgi:hypothetical protein
MKPINDFLTTITLGLTIYGGLSGSVNKFPWLYGGVVVVLLLLFIFQTLIPNISSLKKWWVKFRNVKTQAKRVNESLVELTSLLIEYCDFVGDRNSMNCDSMRFLIRDQRASESIPNTIFNNSFYYEYLSTLIKLGQTTRVPAIALCEIAIGFNLVNNVVTKIWPKVDTEIKLSEAGKLFKTRYNEKVVAFEKLFRKVPSPLEYPMGYNGCGNYGFEKNFDLLLD